MTEVEFTRDHEKADGPLYRCPVVNCLNVIRSKKTKPKCPQCDRPMDLVDTPFESDTKGKR